MVRCADRILACFGCMVRCSEVEKAEEDSPIVIPSLSTVVEHCARSEGWIHIDHTNFPNFCPPDVGSVWYCPKCVEYFKISFRRREL